MSKGIPNGWFPPSPAPLAEDGFSVRFDDETTAQIARLAGIHGVSRAKIVRILVGRSLAEMAQPSRVA